jgi:hypothetical protein
MNRGALPPGVAGGEFLGEGVTLSGSPGGMQKITGRATFSGMLVEVQKK